MMIRKIACLLLLVSVAYAAEKVNSVKINGDQVKILNGKKIVDLTSHLMKVTTTLDIENIGSQAVKEIFVPVEPFLEDHLSYISANDGSIDEKDLKVTAVKDSTSGKLFRQVSLPSALNAKAKTTVVVYQVFRSAQQPYPREAKQADPQLVVAKQSAYIYSPYSCVSQTTVFKLASSKVISYTRIEPSAQNSEEVEYGPFENVKANTLEEVSVHFENHSPFLTVTNLQRWIEVSHWGGNIAVEETIEMKHSGAKLDGSFSRFDYMYLRSTDNIPSVKSYKTVLPAGSKDVYYRDEIGNISTSNMQEMLDSVELDIRPRYPLFGGWVTHYMLGYNLPSFQYLFHSGSEYILRMRFVDHIFDDMSIDSMTVNIVLPEGAHDFRLDVPYEYERGEDSLHYTYLDSTGRPMITLHKKNLVEDHIQDFQLHYKFNSLVLAREPLMLIIGLLIMFLSVIGFVRLDFSISIDSSAEMKMKIAGATEQVMELQNKREAMYSKFENALVSYRKTKNLDALQNARRVVESESKEIKAAVDLVCKSVREDSVEVYERIVEIQRQEATYLGLVTDAQVNAAKVVAGGMSQESFKRAEETSDQKKTDLRTKINKLISLL